MVSVLIAVQALTFNPRSMKEVRKFGNWTFAENGADTDKVDLTDDLMALGIIIELDITIATASNPYNHGIAEIVERFVADVDGDEEHIRLSGYGAMLQTIMYSRRRPMNWQLGAVGANQIVQAGFILPCQIPSNRGEKVNLSVEFNDELELDSTAANITINSGCMKTWAYFGAIDDETWIVKGSDNFGVVDYNIRMAGEGKFCEQMSIFGDEELATAEYDVINQLVAKIGATSILSMEALALTCHGHYLASPIVDADYFLAAAYGAFQNDELSRGLLIQLPAVEIKSDLLMLMDRAAADNVHYNLLQSKPVEAGGEEKLSKKAEPTTLKRRVS